MATDKLVDFDHVTDYISREAAIEKITALINKSGKYTAYESGADDACYIVEHEISAADVRPVVMGEWIDIRPINQSTFERIAIKGAYNKCSLCGRLCFFEENFCPNCGADMRGPNLDTTKGDSHD